MQVNSASYIDRIRNLGNGLEKLEVEADGSEISFLDGRHLHLIRLPPDCLR